MENKYIDMHVHSDYSDGSFNVEEIVDIAKKNKTKILAIADHDCISSLVDLKKYLDNEMIGVKGVEFSSYINVYGKKYKLHILGYCFDEENIKFKSIISEMLEKRRKSHYDLLKLVKDKITNFPEENLYLVNTDKYCWFDRVLLKYLEDNNISKENLEYLQKYFKTNRFSYGNDYDLDVKTVIDAIHSAGGYVIFAHPMAYGYDNETVSIIINKLTELGIDGLESYQSDCTIENTIWLNSIASENNLLSSVGSDFHRTERSDGRMISLGIDNNLCIEETSLTNKILERKQFIKK